FQFFKNNNCNGTAFDTQTGAAVSGTSATSNSHLNLAAGNYSFNAQYIALPNDTLHNNSAVSTCEPFVIDQAGSTTATDIHNAADDSVITGTSQPLGTSVYDSALVTTGNPFATKPTGTVTFKFYSTTNCTDAGVGAGSAPVTQATGVASPSNTKGPLAAGDYG